jgi:hypothetical protein
MRSGELGTSTSATEVTSISGHGFRLLLDGQQRFLPFRDSPWFADATVARSTKVERPQPHHLHLYWPELDVDLHVESLNDAAKYPLVSRHRPMPGPTATATPGRHS